VTGLQRYQPPLPELLDPAVVVVLLDAGPVVVVELLVVGPVVELDDAATAPPAPPLLLLAVVW
jgi:hypothetical protein